LGFNLQSWDFTHLVFQHESDKTDCFQQQVKRSEPLAVTCLLLDTLQTSYLASCFHSPTFHQGPSLGFTWVNTPHRWLIHFFKRQGKVSEIPMYFQFPSEFSMSSVGQIRVLPSFHQLRPAVTNRGK
jgi:hypothetical protein